MTAAARMRLRLARRKRLERLAIVAEHALAVAGVVFILALVFGVL